MTQEKKVTRLSFLQMHETFSSTQVTCLSAALPQLQPLLQESNKIKIQDKFMSLDGKRKQTVSLKIKKPLTNFKTLNHDLLGIVGGSRDDVAPLTETALK